EALEAEGGTVLGGRPFAVTAVGKDDRGPAVIRRAKHVGAQDEAVVHTDGHVPVGAQAVADFALEGGQCRPRSSTKSNVAALPPASLTCITRSRLKMGSRTLTASPGK